MAVQDDYVMTIESDTEEAPPASSSKAGKSTVPPEDAQLNPDFVFDLTGDPYNDLLGGSVDVEDLVKSGSKPVRLLLASYQYRLLMYL